MSKRPDSGECSFAYTHFMFPRTEVVLAVLIENFRFDLTDNDIYWNSTGIQYPSVGCTDEKGQLPLRVSLVEPR